MALLILALCYLTYYVFWDQFGLGGQQAASQETGEPKDGNQTSTQDGSYSFFPDPVLYELISSTHQFGIVDQDSFSHYTKSSLRYPAVKIDFHKEFI